MKTSVALSFIVITSAVLPAHATPDYTTSQCQAWFKANDRNRDGALGTGENVGKFYDRITLANEENDNYIMSRPFFIAECKIGSFGKPPF